MLMGLVWILGLYATGLISVHWLYSRSLRSGKERSTHYVLMTRNNQLQLEWYIRSLQFFSWIKGRNIQLTVVDDGSTDDTLAIIERLARDHPIQSVQVSGWDWDDWIFRHEDEQVVVIWLSHNEGLETAFKY